MSLTTKIKGEYIDVCCPVCEGLKFENIDYFKNQTSDQKLCLCQSCGHIIYNPQPTNECLVSYYKSDYRKKVEIGNIITCNRKIKYHQKFLGKVLDNPGRMVDLGCANGYFANLCRQKGWEAMGTEHTIGFVNYARGEFGLDIRGNLNDFEGQFDLISYYHVLEHIQNPHIELAKAWSRLNDGGMLYVSIPHFGMLEDASMLGAQIHCLDGILPLEHLNYFSRTHIGQVLANAGFEIIRENRFFYGLTLLAKKTLPIPGLPQKVNLQDTKRKLTAMYEAIKLSNKGDFEGAIETFPLFPSAWLNFAMTHKKFGDALAILQRAMKIMLFHTEIASTMGHTYYRNGMFKEALASYRWSFELKPGNDSVAKQMGLCYCELGDFKEGIKWFKVGLEINPMDIVDFQKWIGWAYSKMK